MAEPWQTYRKKDDSPGPWRQYDRRNQYIPSGDYTQEDWDKLENDPTRGMSSTQRFTAGYGGALPQMARGVGQRLGMVSQEEVDRAAELDKPLLNTTAGSVGRTAGLAVPLAGTSIIPGANTVAGGAAIGALSGLAEPTQTGDSVGGNVAKGAILGGAGSMLARLLPAASAAPRRRRSGPVGGSARRATVGSWIISQSRGSHARCRRSRIPTGGVIGIPRSKAPACGTGTGEYVFPHRCIAWYRWNA